MFRVVVHGIYNSFVDIRPELNDRIAFNSRMTNCGLLFSNRVGLSSQKDHALDKCNKLKGPPACCAETKKSRVVWFHALKMRCVDRPQCGYLGLGTVGARAGYDAFVVTEQIHVLQQQLCRHHTYTHPGQCCGPTFRLHQAGVWFSMLLWLCTLSPLRWGHLSSLWGCSAVPTLPATV